MKRHLWYAIPLFLMALAAFSILWSLYTQTGSRVLLKGVQAALSGTVEMKKVTGRIGQSLHMEGITVSLENLTVVVDSADLKWRPHYLVTGKLAINRLHVTGVSITSRESKKDEPVDLSLPQLPKWFTLFNAWIAKLNVDRLSYQTPESEPVIVTGISASAFLDRGNLFVNALDVRSEYGSLKGTVIIDLVRPALQARLGATLPEKSAGMDRISVDTRFLPSQGKEQVAGPLVVKGFSGTQEQIRLHCTVGVSRQALRVSDAKIARKDGKGSIEARGTLDLSGKAPAFILSARIAGLDLAPETGTSTDLSGNLDIAGTLEEFEGGFDLRNRAVSWKDMELKGNIRGDNNLVELAGIEARLLGGVIAGNISISRARDRKLSASLTGSGLNPARLKSGLEGNLNFELTGDLLVPEGKALKGSLKASLRQSRFQNRTVSAKLDAAFIGEMIRINALMARGNGFILTADGVVQDRLTYEIRIDDASKLLPGTTGNLSAKGWARWLSGEVAGTLTARGSGISQGGVKVSSLAATVKMPEGPRGDLAVDVTGRGLSYDTFRADTAGLKINGKMGDHRIALAIQHNKGGVETLAQGRYADGVWKGSILKVSGKQESFGSFNLAAPATLNISKKLVALSPFVLTGPDGEKMDMSANVALEPVVGSAAVKWERLNLARASGLMGRSKLEGRLSGEVNCSLLPGDRFDLRGQAAVSGGHFTWYGDEGEITAPVKEAVINWAWKDASVRGTVNLTLAQYGQAEAAFQIPLAARLPLKMDSAAPAMVSLRGTMTEKGFLAALLPGLARETTGQVDFNLSAGGTLADPSVNGTLNLKGASAYLPPAGIHLEDVSANVQFDNKRIIISSFLARSGAGHIRTSGTVVHGMGKVRTFEGTLKGDRFEAVNLPELQVKINPELSFNGNPEKMAVRGSILIPQALVQEEHRENLVKPSSDVVVEGRGEGPKQALPFALDVAISVNLGDDVLVQAYGIDTRLAGQVRITMKDPEDIRASGRVRTVKGKFDAYGVKLDIRRGNIFFGGGQVDTASLDILALRTVGDVSAGVLVTGTPASPLVNLYSQPPMTDRDTLSYIVLGRASGTAGGSDAALLARAASGLLAGRRSSAIQKQLGLDVLDVESADGDISKSIVRVGKYLSPRLFVSYGRSIYTGEDIFGIRYSLTKRVDVESTMGNQSGAAIYYRIEFK